jgi:hypothetical protein
MFASSALRARTTMTVTCRAQRATCQCPFWARHLGRGLWRTSPASSATGAPGPLFPLRFPAPGPHWQAALWRSDLIGLQGALHLAQPTTVTHYHDASGSAAAGHCRWHSMPGIRPSNADGDVVTSAFGSASCRQPTIRFIRCIAASTTVAKSKLEAENYLHFRKADQLNLT